MKTYPLLAFEDLAPYEWLDVPAWVFDPERARKRWANEAALAFWQADSLEELLARDYSDRSDAAYRRLQTTMALHAEGKVARERWTVYPRGVPVTAMTVSRGVVLPEGGQGVLFVARPLTEAVDPAVLRGVEALQHTTVCVSLHRLDTLAPLMRNAMANATFGAIDSDHCRFDFISMFCDPDRARQAVAAVRQGQPSGGESMLDTLAGARWFGFGAYPVTDPVTGTASLLLSGRDLTDLKTALDELAAARDRADAANRAKSTFLANMSHEIRTPMNGVLGLTDLVLATALMPRQREYLEMAQRSGRALLRVIDDVLDLSKIEAGRLALLPTRFDVRLALRDTLEPLRLQAAARGLRFDWQVDDAVPQYLVADALRLRQIITNLAGNALKFSEHGGIDVALGLAPPLDADAPWALECSVRDSGIGMSADQLARVFEPFTQADGSITRRYGGTGLGLSIVQRLVHLMGGSIDVTSEPGRGSCFRVRLQVDASGAKMGS